DYAISQCRLHRVCFLSTHGNPGKTSVLSTEESFRYLAPHAQDAKIIFNPVCEAALPGENVPSLIRQQRDLFRRLSIGQNGRITVLEPVMVDGKPTAYYYVKSNGKLLPADKAFSTCSLRTGEQYGTSAKTVEALLNRKGAP